MQLVSEVSATARALGVLALIFAVAALIVPFIGPIFLTIPASIFTMVAFYKGDKKLGTIAFGIIAVNLIISPSFWLNLAAGAGMREASPNRVMAILDILFSLGILPFLFRKSK